MTFEEAVERGVHDLLIYGHGFSIAQLRDGGFEVVAPWGPWDDDVVVVLGRFTHHDDVLGIADELVEDDEGELVVRHNGENTPIRESIPGIAEALAQYMRQTWAYWVIWEEE